MGFTLTFHGKSLSCGIPDWLCSRFEEHLREWWHELKALYNLEPIVDGDYVTGVQFNVKEPAKIAKKLKRMKSSQVRVQYLGKNPRLYMTRAQRYYFKSEHAFNPEDVDILCELEGDLLNLYFPKEKRLPTIESVFGKR